MKWPSGTMWLWLLGGVTIALCLVSLGFLVAAVLAGYHCQDTGAFFAPGYTCTH